MTPSVTPCPEVADFRLMLAGVLAPAEVERIAQHLEQCAACQAAFQKQKGAAATAPGPHADPLASTREVKSTGSPPLPGPRLQASAPDFLAEKGPSAGNPGKSTRKLDFLEPPRAPGELGWLAHYRILRQVGAGGMGMVFEAEDSQLQRRLALKVMLPELAAEPTARERFLQEARSAAAVPHDYIVTIFQVGQHNNVPYLAMQFLEGESLEDRLQRERKLPVADVLRISREVALGLAAAHAQGLIHRDIKPANVWLEAAAPRSSPGAAPHHSGFKRVKILDFGLARQAAAPSRLTGTGFIVGTPGFLAPEQARGLPIDHRCDLFSLGCLIHCMVTGDTPFGGSDLLAVLSSLAMDEPQSLSLINTQVPDSLSQLTLELLAKKPEDRPASARDVAERLVAIEQELGIVHCDVESGPLPRAPSGARPTARKTPGGSRIGSIIGVAGVLVLLGLVLILWFNRKGTPGVVAPQGEPIRVGVLHSLTGPMAASEEAVEEATLLAIEELNQRGGLLGRPVKAIVEDGQSDDKTFFRLAEKLITEDRVAVVFGCWTSSSRRAVRPIFEKHNHLLLYPVQYEGLADSPNIVYLGSTPNQQILPALDYARLTLRKRRVFLIGSDYVFPRAAHAIIRDALIIRDNLKDEPDVQIVGEVFLPLGTTLVAPAVQAIVEAKPDLILNTINGDTNIAFFRELRSAGIPPDRVPTISFSIAENELRSLSARDMVGDYAAMSYFQSIDRPENAEFVRKFKAKYGPHRVTSDPMEAAYCGVQLWALAVAKAGTTDPAVVLQTLKGMSYAAPQGTIRIDPDNNNTWKHFRLGRVAPGGQFEILETRETPIRPQPYPAGRTRAQWDLFLNQLYEKWGGRWENPMR